MKEISEQEALELLRAQISYGRRITGLAKELGVSQAFMSAVLAGQKRMTDPMLKLIGVERRVTYFLARETENPVKRSVPKGRTPRGEA